MKKFNMKNLKFNKLFNMYTCRFIENMFIIIAGIIITNIYIYFSPIQVLSNIYYLRNKRYGYKGLLNMKLPLGDKKLIPNGNIMNFMCYNKNSFWKYYFLNGKECNVKINLEKVKVNIFKNVYILNVIGKEKDEKSYMGYYLECFKFLFRNILDEDELNKCFINANKEDIEAHGKNYTVIYFNNKKDAEETLELLDSYLVLKQFSE